jgi:chorismate--pyruvate lyase
MSTLSGPQRHLANLGNKPLGAVLFADPHMQRDRIEVARLQAPHYFYLNAVQGLASVPDFIWGRRSVFYLNRKPLLVNEIFLPDMECCNVS